MSTNNVSRSGQGDKTRARHAQQRALLLGSFPNHPLARVPDATFEAVMSSAVMFDGPVVAVLEWVVVSGEVDAMIAMGLIFEPWIAAASLLYGIYKDWQQDKKDEKMAEKIVQRVIAAVGAMIDRAVKNVKSIILENEIINRLDTLQGRQRDMKEHLERRKKGPFDGIDIAFFSKTISDCNELLPFFTRNFRTSIEESDTAQATALYGHIVDTVLLKNQTYEWQDNNAEGPPGSNEIARQGVMELYALLQELLVAVRRTSDKQFSSISYRHVDLRLDGTVIRHSPFPEPEVDVAQSLDVWSYYFRGNIQGEVLDSQGSVVGFLDQTYVFTEIERRKEEEYLRMSLNLRAMGDRHQQALEGF